jgi:hypothetical protein
VDFDLANGIKTHLPGEYKSKALAAQGFCDVF